MQLRKTTIVRSNSGANAETLDFTRTTTAYRPQLLILLCRTYARTGSLGDRGQHHPLRSHVPRCIPKFGCRNSTDITAPADPIKGARPPSSFRPPKDPPPLWLNP